MAMMAKDGTRHHSASRASLHDELSANKGPATALPKKKEESGGPKPGMAHPEPSKVAIKDHVAEHGPAHQVHHIHDQATGKHHVTTHHGEGENGKHHSVHDSHEAAHEHMGVAMGVGNAAKEEEKDHEDFETPDTEEAEMTRAGGGIPGLS